MGIYKGQVSLVNTRKLAIRMERPRDVWIEQASDRKLAFKLEFTADGARQTVCSRPEEPVKHDREQRLMWCWVLPAEFIFLEVSPYINLGSS
jgi:uncharacterized paraquat-inducible protein A